jgi:hypothetical protein
MDVASSKTHPHIDMPPEDALEALVEDLDPVVRQLYLDVHRLVTETVPDASYSADCEDAAIGYGARQFGYDGWGMAALAPYRSWVSLGFLRGASLHDPDGLLEGTGTAVRHVKLRSAEEFARRRDAIKCLLQEAAGLNQP